VITHADHGPRASRRAAPAVPDDHTITATTHRMPATGAAARPPAAPIDETFFEWVQLHTRELLIGLAAVIVVLAGVALYHSASVAQALQAEQALVGPEQSIAAGNLPLAQSDLKKVITRYAGTPAAAQAALLLAETYYDQQKYADGIAVLQRVGTSRAVKPFSPAVDALMADGYTQQGKFAQAASHLAAAADASPYPTEQARLRASAARAYAKAGDTKTATAIWTRLAADPKGAEAQEARLRLGELTARPAGKA
jgi:predicted negative regulator of RcsB-dependent stress response